MEGTTTAAPAGRITPEQIAWRLSRRARQEAQALGFTPAAYEAARLGIQRALCSYFNAGDCLGKASNISPMRSGIAGCKGLKMRWLLPGQGKSGGLRMAVAVFCEERRVKIGALFARKDDPSDDELIAGFAEE